MKFRRPSHATVVAYLALFVALGGMAVAATRITSSKQIKAGVVNSGDVKDENLKGRDIRDRSLSGADIAADSITAVELADNAVGKATSFSAFVDASIGIDNGGSFNIPNSPAGDLVTLSLPAGTFVITAHAGLSSDDNGAGVYCLLNPAGGDAVETGSAISGIAWGANDYTPESLAVSTRTTSNSPFVVRLSCSDADTGARAFDRGIEAIRLP